MTLRRVAPVAIMALVLSLNISTASAQIFDTGQGVCRWCGHSEKDTKRYVNWFLNELFFYPGRVQQKLARAGIATSLYLFTATFDIYGAVSPSSKYNVVTIAITAEIKKGIPTGRYMVTATTKGGKTSTKAYAIGNSKYSVGYGYARGAVQGGGSGGSVGRSGPPSGGSYIPPKRGARCSRSRRVDAGNETIVFCSRD